MRPKSDVRNPVCRNCSNPKVNRPRGLCWTCYYTPGIRDRFVSTSKFARRGVGNVCRVAVRDARPTTAAPGSPEKLAVLADRAARGVALFHPQDGEGPTELSHEDERARSEAVAASYHGGGRAREPRVYRCRFGRKRRNPDQPSREVYFAAGGEHY